MNATTPRDKTTHAVTSLCRQRPKPWCRDCGERRESRFGKTRIYFQSRCRRCIARRSHEKRREWR